MEQESLPPFFGGIVRRPLPQRFVIG